MLCVCVHVRVPQVARDLQKVCRANPKKSRPSCRKKQKPSNGDDVSTSAKALTVDVASESEIEMVIPCSAMAEMASTEAHSQGHTFRGSMCHMGREL